MGTGPLLKSILGLLPLFTRQLLCHQDLFVEDICENARLEECLISSDHDCSTAILNRELLSLDRKTTSGYTLLHLSTFLGNTDVALRLLRQGADPSITDSRFQSPLCIAAGAGDVNMMHLLIQMGASMEAPCGYEEAPALVQGLKQRRLDATLYLLQRGASLNSGGKAFPSAGSVAAGGGAGAAGAAVQAATGARGITLSKTALSDPSLRAFGTLFFPTHPIHYLVTEATAAAAEEQGGKGGSSSSSSGASKKASSGELLRLLGMLLSRGQLSAGAANEFGTNALMFACLSNSPASAAAAAIILSEAVLKKKKGPPPAAAGADALQLDASTAGGMQAFSICSWHGSHQVLELLLLAAASQEARHVWEARTHDQQTLLHLAAKSGSVETLQLLLEPLWEEEEGLQGKLLAVLRPLLQMQMQTSAEQLEGEGDNDDGEEEEEGEEGSERNIGADGSIAAAGEISGAQKKGASLAWRPENLLATFRQLKQQVQQRTGGQDAADTRRIAGNASSSDEADFAELEEAEEEVGSSSPVFAARTGICSPLLEARDSNGMTPLLAACGERRLQSMVLLLAHGADAAARTSSGDLSCAALFFALPSRQQLLSRELSQAVLDLLLDAGGDMNSLSRTGASALSIALQQGQEQAAVAMLHKGANPFLLVPVGGQLGAAAAAAAGGAAGGSSSSSSQSKRTILDIASSLQMTTFLQEHRAMQRAKQEKQQREGQKQ